MLSLDGLPIDKSEDIKLLGVHIDDDLVFKKHLSELYMYQDYRKVGILYISFTKFKTKKLSCCCIKFLFCPTLHIAT